MTLDELSFIRQKLTDFETKTTHQIVILTINSLGNESIESYALNVFNENQLGQKENDNGILILFAKDDRKVRIEVGYGLEPVVTDAISSRIIRNIMIPNFKDEDYFEGLDQGVDEIIKIISDPVYANEFAEISDSDSDQMMPWWGRILVFLFFGGFLSIFIAIGATLFWTAYKDLINAYRGLFSKRISVLAFPFTLIGTAFMLLFGFVFMMGPIIGLLFILSEMMFNGRFVNMLNNLPQSRDTILWSIMSFVTTGFVILPILLAILKITNVDKRPFGMSFLHSDRNYIKKYISVGSSSGSSGSSSSRSYSSSGSSSSFSGGGGSSGGGGASGGW